VDEQTLENLFRLSNFALKNEDKKQWQTDIAQWLEFFALEAGIDADNTYQFVGHRTVQELRDDAQVASSLRSSDIKLFSKRFVDGFIALPEHQRHEPQ
jgi:Asp-tRNA(Asn)/Glu-tRNA(Gln) amidotransferase C subunit